VLVLPTLIWSLANQDLLFARVGKFDMRPELPLLAVWSRGIIDLALAAAAFSAFCIIVYAAVAFTPFGGAGEVRGGVVEGVAIRRLVQLIPVTCLGLLVLFVLATETTNISDRWLQPYLFLTPLAMFIALEHRLDRARQLAIAGIGAGIAAAVIVALLVYNRLPDLRGHPSRTAAPFEVIAADIRRLGFDRGTIISPQNWVAGNLLFRLPGAAAITPEYTRMPVTYPPPILLATESGWEESLPALGRAFAEICGGPLPEAIPHATLSAPHIGSALHSYELRVAVILRCSAVAGGAPLNPAYASR
jgi:hypothetical protein